MNHRPSLNPSCSPRIAIFATILFQSLLQRALNSVFADVLNEALFHIRVTLNSRSTAGARLADDAVGFHLRFRSRRRPTF